MVKNNICTVSFVFHKLSCNYVNFSFMLEFLTTVGVTHHTVDTLVSQCEKVIAMLTQGGVSPCVCGCVMACVTIRECHGRHQTKR